MGLTMRTIGGRIYSVFDEGQRVGRIFFDRERLPPRWVWSFATPSGLPISGASLSLEGAQADFEAAWTLA